MPLPKTMPALVKAEPREGIWLQGVPVPTIGARDVLIRVRKTGICGTDIHIYNWDAWSQRTVPTPLVVGHEFVGEIVEVGGQVQAFTPGQLVSGEGHVIVGRCRNFLAGRRHLCRDVEGVGIQRPGAFAQYIALPEDNVWLHPEGLAGRTGEDVLSIFDPLGNAVHTALSFDMVGEDVLVTGAGPIGCMACAVAKKAGARHVVITDVNPYRLKLAKTLGADLTVDVRTESLDAAQQSLGMTEGFDVGLEMSGSADALRQMLGSMIHGGKVSLLGLPAGGKAAIDWNDVIFKMLTIKGIYGREIFETWHKMTTLVQGGLDVSPVITHRFGYEDFQQGFDAMRSGQSGKVVLDWA